MKNLGAERLAGHRAVTAAELIRMPKSDWLRTTSTALASPAPWRSTPDANHTRVNWPSIRLRDAWEDDRALKVPNGLHRLRPRAQPAHAARSAAAACVRSPQ